MKKIFISLIVIFAALSLNAAKYTISFEGKNSSDNSTLKLQQIQVENLTQNWKTTLSEQVLLEVELNSEDPDPDPQEAIDVVKGAISDLSLVGQNPFNGNTQVRFSLQNADKITMSIIDLSGRQIFTSSQKMQAGEWLLNVSVQMPQMCFISIASSKDVKTAKLINTGFASNNSVSVISTSPLLRKPLYVTENFQCKVGDKMRYKGWTVQDEVRYGDVKEAVWEEKNATITFEFDLLPKEEKKPEPDPDPQPQPDPEVASGMYLGLIGFNNNFYYKEIVYLTKNTKEQFLNTIIDTKLQELKDGKFKNGTLLYEADWRALDSLKSFVAPKDLANAAVVTFTDGEDRASYTRNEFFKEDDNGNKYEDSLKYRIAHEKVGDVAIKAYSIGKKGSDVASEDIFKANLRTISSGDGYWYPVNNMTEVNEKFEAIANDLYKVNIISDVTLSSVGYNGTTQVCWTFDLDSASSIIDWPTSAYTSARYIKAELGRKKGKFYLAKIDCVGLTYEGWKKVDPDTIWGVENELFNYDFTFKNVRVTENDQAITEVVEDMKRMTRQWTWVESTSKWHKETEFSGNNMKDSEINTSSAVIMLVLDCSSSLSAEDFSQLKAAAKKFVNIISAKVTDEGGESGDPTTDPEEPSDGLQKITIAQARSLALGLDEGKTSEKQYRIERGWVYDVKVNLSYNNANFTLFNYTSETVTKQDSILCYRLNYLGNKGFTSEGQLVDYDDVQVVAKVTNYNGEPELTDGYIEKVTYVDWYIKHPWGTGNTADWAWKQMVRHVGDALDGKCVYQDCWGDNGCNLNIVPTDNGALWITKDQMAIHSAGYYHDYRDFTNYMGYGIKYYFVFDAVNWTFGVYDETSYNEAFYGK